MVRAEVADSSAAQLQPATFGEDFRQLFNALPVAVYACEAPSGVITFFNNQAARLWGRRPRTGDSEERFCGAYRLFYPDGAPLPHNRTPMARALLEGTTCRNQEVMIERPDGSRVTVLVNIEPVRDKTGRVVAAINAFHEVAPTSESEKAAAHLAAIVDSSDDAIVSKNLQGIIQTWNRGAERIFGYTAQEAVGQSITMIIPSERRHEEDEILRRLRAGERIDHFETVRVRKDGTLLDISLTISPVRDRQGRIIGASKIARDITERKRLERELAEYQKRYAQSLEEKVERTTAELSQSRERLRLAERMASLGTLSAGLGHDMGNVLMPLRAHVDALAVHLPPNGNGSREHLDSIRKSMEYLHTLAGGLRMLAIDPTQQQGFGHAVRLSQWWSQTQPILRTALGRHFALEHDLREDLPAVALPMHLLTQAVFNLVQNAAQAMNGPPPTPGGRVRISAVESDDAVRLTVADNGPGMSAQVRDRCVEPYFTTKPRGISTGLGLTLVHGIVHNAGGALEIESAPGRGASFTLVLPIASPATGHDVAAMHVGNQRLAALLRHVLDSLNVRVVSGDVDADVLLTEDASAAQQFLGRDSQRRAIVFGDPLTHRAADDRLIHLPSNAKTAEIRKAVADALTVTRS